MNWYGISSLSAAITILCLGFFVYLKNRKNSVNIIFALTNLCLAAWAFGDFIFSFGFLTDAVALIWAKICHIGAVFVPVMVVHFFFAIGKIKWKKRVFQVAYLISAILLIFDLATPFFIKEISSAVIFGFSRKVMVGGPAYTFFTLFMAWALVYGFYQLFRKYKKLLGHKQHQIKYIFFAAGVAFTASFIYFIPTIFGINIPPIDNLFLVAYMGIIAYAIVRHELMDISIIIKRATIYSSVTAVIAFSYISLVLFFDAVFRGFSGHERMVPSVLAAIIIAFTFAPLKQVMQRRVDKLFKKAYNPAEILKELGEILSSVFRMDELLEKILSYLPGTMGISESCIILKDKRTGNYTVKLARGAGMNSEPVRMKRNGHLVRRLGRKKKVIIREVFEQRASSKNNMEGLLEGLGGEMRSLKAEVAVPILAAGELLGVLCLGNKESGDVFTREDTDLFMTLSPEIAIAIENARLYTRVVEDRVHQENILSSMASGLVAIDANRRITLFNKEAQRVFNLDGAGTRGKSINVLPEQISYFLDKALDNVCYSGHEVLLPSEKKEIPLAVSTSLLKTPREETIGSLFVFTDLTENKRMEAYLRQSERLAALGTLAAGIAHEIKNPLTFLKTVSQISVDKFDDEDFRKNFSRLAGREVTRIDNVVSQLLDFARPSPQAFKKLEIKQLIEETMVLAASEITSSGVRIIKSFPAGANPALLGDAGQMKQVFLNLLLNSIEVISEKGQVKIEVELLPDAVKPQKILIKFSDTGKGISPKDVPHVFDPFFTRKTHGMGLGLAIVSRIVKEHRGSIEVKSKVGKGTTFSILLPALKEEG